VIKGWFKQVKINFPYFFEEEDAVPTTPCPFPIVFGTGSS
jgi:hypothetical protein